MGPTFVYSEDDTEGVKRGNAIACAFCQIVAGAVQKQYKLNKERPREERYGEDETEEVLLQLCAQTAPGMAKALQGYKKDAEMLCNRVVKENIGDMIDAASLGEDMDTFCRENNICPLNMGDMMKMVEMMVKSANKQQEKEQQGKSSGDDEE